MKHLFVPYELALILKEKGFDEPCLGRYRDKKFQLYSVIKEHCYNSDPISNKDISAPLYQQVIDWFYNKHRIFVEADGYIIDSGEYDGCYGFKATIRVAENYKEKILFAQGEFPTREKAWNKAIEEALKFI